MKSYLPVLLAVVSAPAAAVTVDVSQNANLNDTPFYQTTQTVNLPTGFTNAKLNVVSLVADDLAVVRVNGVNILGAGIFGPGNGNVYFTASGSSTPYAFAYDNGAINASFAAAFVTGANIVEVFYNNNNAGINAGNGPLMNGPGNLAFNGNVSFDVAGVPEPANWALMIGGFGLAGVAARRRRTSIRVTYA